MSIERVERKDGSVVWRVRWRQARPQPLEGARAQARRRGLRRRARAPQAHRRAGRSSTPARRRSPSSARSGGGCTPSRTSRASTLQVYAVLWDAHVLPRLGSIPLRELTPRRHHPLPARARGRRRRARVDPQGARRCSRACSSAPASGAASRRTRSRAVRKPTAAVGLVPSCRSRRRRSRRCAPGCCAAELRPRRDARLGAGLRRSAAGRGAGAHVGAHPRAHAARRGRGVARRDRVDEDAAGAGPCRCSAPLAQDLAEWRLRAGRPDGDALVFPGHDGRPVDADGLPELAPPDLPPARRSRRRRAGARPYDLRHSFVSLLIAEGHNVVEVARQAGHSPKMALDTYAHVFEEFDPAERIDAADRIRTAREELRFRGAQPTLFDVA